MISDQFAQSKYMDTPSLAFRGWLPDMGGVLNDPRLSSLHEVSHVGGASMETSLASSTGLFELGSFRRGGTSGKDVNQRQSRHCCRTYRHELGAGCVLGSDVRDG